MCISIICAVLQTSKLHCAVFMLHIFCKCKLTDFVSFSLLLISMCGRGGHPYGKVGELYIGQGKVRQITNNYGRIGN